jgi:hypothetical protein
METAKVDIRKLQLLNDRINQCIDALNQVRLTVHGLSQVAPGALPSPMGFAGFGQLPLPQFSPALSHSSPFGYGSVPGQVGIGQPGFGQPGFGPAAYGQAGYGQVPFGQGLGQPGFGLSHSSPEETGRAWNDPLIGLRIAQTFPYAQYPYPAVLSIY